MADKKKLPEFKNEAELIRFLKDSLDLAPEAKAKILSDFRRAASGPGPKSTTE